MNALKPFLTVTTFFLLHNVSVCAQHNDTEIPAISEAKGAKHVKERLPRKAAIRSAIVPGWGQVYNKKVWKVPIVYAAVGATGGLFLYNLKWYERYREGVQVIDILNKSKSKPGDSTAYLGLNRNVKLTNENGTIEAVRFFRDDFRRNVDYAAIYFVLAWALNVVEATVDAHLSGFDVSPDLSLNVQPSYNVLNRTAGLNFIVKLK